MSSVSFPCYLGFAQWKSDLIVHEIVTVIKRQEAKGQKNEILLAALGAVVSPLAKQLLAEEKCKLKRFVANATADFEIVGHGGLEKVVFLGDEARVATPAGLPADMAQKSAMLNAAPVGELDADQVLEEIAVTLSQCKDQTLFVSQIGARLRPETRQWLKIQSIKLLNFVQDSLRFTIDHNAGREKVTLVNMHVKRSSSTCSNISGYSSISEVSVHSPAYNARDFIAWTMANHDPASLAAVLCAHQPVVYED